jgi:hypothetical protein
MLLPTAPWRLPNAPTRQKAKWQVPFLSIHVNDSFLVYFLLSIFIPTNHIVLLNERKDTKI